MAIFGSFSDFPLVECLGLIGDRCGKLVVTQLLGNRTIELQLEYANVRRAVVDGRDLNGLPELIECVANLASSLIGEFEFLDLRPTETLHGPFNEPVQMLLDLAQQRQAAPGLREHDLPHPETRFRATGAALPWMDDALFEFYERAQRLLSIGASGSDLSRWLTIPTETVLGHLAHLRAHDVIEIERQPQGARPATGQATLTLPRPQTAAVSTPKPAAQAAPDTGLISRLLGALRRRRFM